MPIPVACTCGRTLKLRDELAGKKIRCPQCSATVAVPKKEGDEADYVVTEVVEESVTATQPRPAPKSRPEPKASKSSDRPKRKKSRLRERDDEYESRPWIAVNPQIITGLLMMAGAVIWFVVGLSIGYIYFYPPVLFVFGIAAVVRGFTGGD